MSASRTVGGAAWRSGSRELTAPRRALTHADPACPGTRPEVTPEATYRGVITCR